MGKRSAVIDPHRPASKDSGNSEHPPLDLLMPWGVQGPTYPSLVVLHPKTTANTTPKCLLSNSVPDPGPLTHIPIAPPTCHGIGFSYYTIVLFNIYIIFL